MYWQAFGLVFDFKKIYIKSRSLKKILLRNKLEKDILKLSTSYLIAPLAIQITTSDHIREIEVCTAGCKLKKDQLNKTPSQQLEVTLKTVLL